MEGRPEEGLTDAALCITRRPVGPDQGFSSRPGSADSDDCGRGFRLNATMRSDRRRPPFRRRRPGFVAGAVEFAVMQAAERNGEWRFVPRKKSTTIVPWRAIPCFSITGKSIYENSEFRFPKQ